ncbi:MAG: TIGR01212 family radical SAM protein [Calditrichaeota bacterium]|nr:MAG: TIGR01212 family radical SAM protein [Calditrichota bacterium]
MRHYNAYKYFLEKRFGEPVLKIPLNGGFTCPNIDGSKGFGGCTYCDNEAFSPVALSQEDVLHQLEQGMSRATYRFNKFIAYFQPYSNTYAPVARLRELYEPVLSHPKIVGLALGTRPDCFAEETFNYLDDVASRTFLSVELGMQTIHNRTLENINRQHSAEACFDVFSRLYEMGIENVVHVVLGLPGESKQDMLATAEKIAALPIHGVKVHQLMIIQKTVMAHQYRNGDVQTLELEEYADLLAEFIKRLRPDQHVHRLMAECREDSGLIAPQWSSNKRHSLNLIHNYFEKIKLRQGTRCKVVAHGV